METSSLDVTLHEATAADQSVIKNLVPCYIHDMSEFMGFACPPDGVFPGCEFLPLYWSEPHRFAFVLRSGEELAGFALVRENTELPDIDYFISEFFVLRKFRHRGVGEKIARQLFDRFRGRWMVDYPASNESGARFWPKVVDRYCAGKFEERVGHCQYGETTILLFNNSTPLSK